jgi:hypothetical protein
MKLRILFLYFLVWPVICAAQVSVIVNKGPFSSVKVAAEGEGTVDFFDKDTGDDLACTECFAATELAKFLPFAINIKTNDIKFADPKNLPENGNVYLIGTRSTNSLIGKYDQNGGSEFKSEQSYLIRSFMDKNRVITIIEGAGRIGTLYGVYRYLEELGIKFFGLGEKGITYPDSQIAIPSDLKIIENPSYLTRGFYTWNDRKTDSEFFLWMARNKLNYWTTENQPVNLLKKLGVKLSAGGHRTQGIVFNSDDEYPYNHPKFKGDENKLPDPYKVGDEYIGDTNNDGKLSYFEAHPEWYGMKDGKRMKIIYTDNASQTGINFCTSNEDARKEFAKRVGQQLIDGQWRYVDLFEFWLFDGGPNLWCSCEKCKQTGGSYSDKLLTVTYEILKELNRIRLAGKINRRVEVSSIAYHATLDPPTKPLPDDYDYNNSSITFFPIGRCYVHSFADPACTEINQWQLKAYEGWTMGDRRYYQGSVFIGEYYNVSSFKNLPVVFSRIMAVDIPWYYKNGARQFHYMHTPDTLWGTWTLNQYLMGKLLWNVDADAAKILDGYFNHYYPTTSYTTRRFYEQLESATANIKVFKHYVETENGTNYTLRSRLLKGNLFQLDHLHYDEFHPMLNDGPDVVEMIDAMGFAKKYLDESLIKCNNSFEQKRLMEDKERFDYGYSMYMFIYHMIRTSVFHKEGDIMMAAKEFSIVEMYAEQLRNMIFVAHSSSTDGNAPNGLEATQIVNVFNEFRKLYGKN